MMSTSEEMMKNHHVELPLPWQPAVRRKIHDDIFWPLLKNKQTEDDAMEFFDGYSKVRERYIVSGLGVHALNAVREFIEETETPKNDVLHHFENEMLGLPLTDSVDGLRYFESAAGFAGGTYPAQPVAELVYADTEQLTGIVRDPIASRFGGVILRANNYLVMTHKAHGDNVTVSDVVEMTKKGEGLVDAALEIAAKRD